jgi:hypothetical protein
MCRLMVTASLMALIPYLPAILAATSSAEGHLLAKSICKGKVLTTADLTASHVVVQAWTKEL